MGKTTFCVALLISCLGMALVMISLIKGASITRLCEQPRARKPNCLEDSPAAVFVVATGRSGSTSLLRMLNDIPGYSLKGEDGGIWKRIISNMFFDLLTNATC